MDFKRFFGFWALIMCPIVNYLFADRLSVIGCWIKKTSDEDEEAEYESDPIIDVDQTAEFLQYIGRFNDFLLVTFLFGILHYVPSFIYNATVKFHLNEMKWLYAQSSDIYTKQFIVVRLLRYPSPLHKLAIRYLMECIINALAFFVLFGWMHNGIFFYFVHDLIFAVIFQSCSGRLCVLFEKVNFCGVPMIGCNCIQVSNSRLSPVIAAVWLTLICRIFYGFETLFFFYNAFFTDKLETMSDAFVMAQVMDEEEEKNDKLLKDILEWKVSEESYDAFEEAIPFIFKRE